MGRVYAEAEIKIEQDLIGDPLRKRLAEGSIKIESLPGFNAEPGQEFYLEVDSQEELIEALQALAEGDTETAQKYLRPKDNREGDG